MSINHGVEDLISKTLNPKLPPVARPVLCIAAVPASVSVCVCDRMRSAIAYQYSPLLIVGCLPQESKGENDIVYSMTGCLEDLCILPKLQFQFFSVFTVSQAKKINISILQHV